jgi:hypothetical protein
LIMVGGIASMHVGLPSWIINGVIVRSVIPTQHKTEWEVAKVLKF